MTNEEKLQALRASHGETLPASAKPVFQKWESTIVSANGLVQKLTYLEKQVVTHRESLLVAQGGVKVLADMLLDVINAKDKKDDVDKDATETETPPKPTDS
jgi:hypothetical protein